MYMGACVYSTGVKAVPDVSVFFYLVTEEKIINNKKTVFFFFDRPVFVYSFPFFFSIVMEK